MLAIRCFTGDLSCDFAEALDLLKAPGRRDGVMQRLTAEIVRLLARLAGLFSRDRGLAVAQNHALQRLHDTNDRG